MSQATEQVSHTPGPWSIKIPDHTGALPTGVQASAWTGSLVTVCMFNHMLRRQRGATPFGSKQTIGDTWRANARLIAAAPELLAAAKDWLYLAEQTLSEFDVDSGECDVEHTEKLCQRCEACGCIQQKIRNLRAAIAKAEGR